MMVVMVRELDLAALGLSFEWIQVDDVQCGVVIFGWR
jgi:hypothetical protein